MGIGYPEDFNTILFIFKKENIAKSQIHRTTYNKASSASFVLISQCIIYIKIIYIKKKKTTRPALPPNSHASRPIPGIRSEMFSICYIDIYIRIIVVSSVSSKLVLQKLPYQMTVFIKLWLSDFATCSVQGGARYITTS